MSGDAPPPPSPLPLEKIQGNILRGYRMAYARHFALRVTDPAAARAFILSLVAPPGEGLRVTSAELWCEKPAYCLNLSITYPGLVALQVPDATLQSFMATPSNPPGLGEPHRAFIMGAVKSAGAIGDQGSSAPPWEMDDRRFHVMLSLYADEYDRLDRLTGELEGAWASAFAQAGDTFEAQDLPDDFVYFGYHDNIAQPTVAGGAPRHPDGGQPKVDPGAFLLGTATTTFFQTVPVPSPLPFGLYGSFAAFRKLEQDVDGFDDHVSRTAEQQKDMLDQSFGVKDAALAQDVVKAWICGRWPNGTPLALSPVGGDKPAPGLPKSQLNNFRYVLPDGSPNQDPAGRPDLGEHVPVGCHIRRANNRDAPRGDPTETRRIMRRAKPYQIPYDAADRNSGTRGLMGFFMGASLNYQFEFVQKSWMNASTGFSVVTDPADPMMGGTDPQYETIKVPKPGTDPAAYKNSRIGMQGFVTTKASAYVFFPGIDALHWIGKLTSV